jgi:hypothetical protein
MASKEQSGLPDRVSEYARMAGEAFVAASREADPRRAARLRQRGYDLVDQLREGRRELKERSSASDETGYNNAAE